MSGADIKPREQALPHLRHTLHSGVRGALRDAIEQAIETAEDTGKGELRDMHYRNLMPGKTLADPKRPGFRMRANRSGKVWLYRFENPETGKQQELKLGPYPDVPLSQARELWEQCRKMRLDGKVPSLGFQNGEGRADLPTIEELCNYYVRDYAKIVKRSWRDDERLLWREVVPYYGALQADQFGSGTVSEMLLRIKEERRAPREAEKVRAVLSTLFNVARGRTRKIEFLEGTWLPRNFGNPVDGVNLAKKEPESTDLKLHELRSFLQNLGELREDIAQILRLQLETCARISEVTGLPWSEIDWVEGVWSLPAARAKNKQAH